MTSARNAEHRCDRLTQSQPKQVLRPPGVRAGTKGQVGDLCRLAELAGAGVHGVAGVAGVAVAVRQRGEKVLM